MVDTGEYIPPRSGFPDPDGDLVGIMNLSCSFAWSPYGVGPEYCAKIRVLGKLIGHFLSRLYQYSQFGSRNTSSIISSPFA